MARRNRYIKGKADYTLRKKHLTTNGGVIYENDHMTINPLNELFSDDDVYFSDSNFKFRIRKGVEPIKKHSRNRWITNADSGKTWTKDTINLSGITRETKVVLKPDYSSLKDFAYFGSATEMIRATINNIIRKFPAEIYKLGDDSVKVDVTKGAEKGSFYVVSNDYGINIEISNMDNVEVYNPLRFLCISMDSYEDADGNPITGFTYEDLINGESPVCHKCEIIGKATINGKEYYNYYTNDDTKLLLTKDSGKGVVIRPKQKIIEEYFNNLDGFEAVLLNRTSNPIYMARLETPYETENGYFYQMEGYAWPTIDGYMPDITSAYYMGYLSKLSELGNFYDKYHTDNLWRMLTHESLKNLDWTFVKTENGETRDVSDFDTSRVSSIIRIYGRLLDDIKRYSNAIKTSEKVSYDEKSNAPDYVLSDIIENEGWDAFSVAPSNDNTISSIVKYSGLISGNSYTSYDANINFLRRLKLNSKYIKSLKGTKIGIETILALFGFTKDTDYEINEKVMVARPKEGENGYPSYSTVSDYGMKRDYYDTTIQEEYGTDYDGLIGIPVLRVSPTDNVEDDYVIPWYDKSANYDANIYFQSKGGWMKRKEKRINLDIAPEVSSITSTDIVKLYNETEPYLRFGKDMESLREFVDENLIDNTICYITDISELSTKYNFKEGESTSGLSHYFILENRNLSTYLGYAETYGCYGWRVIREEEYMNPDMVADTDNVAGRLVLYLESLISENRGNNPHTGHGKYDDGDDYFENFRTIFKYPLENDGFSSVDEGTLELISGCGWDISDAVDNKKCWYFEDTTDTGSTLSLLSGTGDEEAIGVEGYEPYNPEDESKPTDEAAAFSIMNTKNLSIVFKDGNEYNKKYIEEKVMPYLTFMIPSTAIFEYSFEGETEPKTRPEITITPTENQNIGTNGGIISVNVSTTSDGTLSYGVSSNVDWCVVNENVITVSENTDTTTRTATISITAATEETENYYAASKSSSFQVIQAAAEEEITITLSVSPTEIPATGGNVSLTVSTNSAQEWTLEGSEITGTIKGVGNQTNTIVILNNEETSAKNLTWSVSVENVSNTATAIQYGSEVVEKYLTINPTTLTFDASDYSEQTININTNCDNISVETTPSDGLSCTLSGDRITVIPMGDNTDTTDKSWVITVKGVGNEGEIKSAQCNVKQNGVAATFIMSPKTKTMKYPASSFTLTITSNTEWGLEVNESWCVLPQTTGTGNATITVNITENDNVENNRVATITGRTTDGSDITATTRITQDKKIFINLESSETMVSALSGSTSHISISSNTDWNVSLDSEAANFATIRPTIGNGNGSITVTFDINSGSVRQATVTAVSNPTGATDSITITQKNEFELTIPGFGREYEWILLDSDTLYEEVTLTPGTTIEWQTYDGSAVTFYPTAKLIQTIVDGRGVATDQEDCVIGKRYYIYVRRSSTENVWNNINRSFIFTFDNIRVEN